MVRGTIWDHLPEDDPNYAAAAGAIFEAVVRGLGEVRLDVDDEVARRAKLEAAIAAFRDSKRGSLLRMLIEQGNVRKKNQLQTLNPES